MSLSSLPSLPKECIDDVLSFLDDSTLYNCLFINRYLCKVSVSTIWRDPFRHNKKPKNSLISTLLACPNEDELIHRSMNYNNQTPLFEYGKFIKIIRHDYCASNVVQWLDSSKSPKKKKVKKSKQGRLTRNRDREIQKCVNTIYHIIMQQGSNLQELVFSHDTKYFPTITTYNARIANLKSLSMVIDMNDQKVIEFLRLVSKFCNGIVNCEFIWISKSKYLESSSKLLLDFFMLQPLEKLSITNTVLKGSLFSNLLYSQKDMLSDPQSENITNALDSLKFRSGTLKELIFNDFDFKYINLSFISKLERLERLEFEKCSGFVSQHKVLFKKKLHLRRLKFWYNDDSDFYNYYFFDGFGSKSNVMEAIINSLCCEALLELSLNIATPETVRAVKESCPNIGYLKIRIHSMLELTIQLVCEISSLKILIIKTVCFYDDDDNSNLLIRTLGDYLTSVECLLLNIYVSSPSFEYFTNNCKANLKKLVINGIKGNERIKCEKNFQSVHNSAKLLLRSKDFLANEEIIDSLKNQRVIMDHLKI